MCTSNNKKIMSKNLKRQMKLANKDRKQICKDLNIKYTTFTDWLNGNTYPRIDKIDLLAKYFGINKFDLIVDRDDDTYEINKIFSILNKMGKQKVLEYAKDIAESEKYTQ